MKNSGTEKRNSHSSLFFIRQKIFKKSTLTVVILLQLAVLMKLQSTSLWNIFSDNNVIHRNKAIKTPELFTFQIVPLKDTPIAVKKDGNSTIT